MANYLVTGGTGYIGFNLIKHISESDVNAQVIALVRNLDKASEMGVDKLATLIEVDLTDSDWMGALTLDVDYVFHCASVTKSAQMVQHPIMVIESIVNTTQNVMKLAVRCGAKSVVYLSSMEVYGDVDCSDGHRADETELGQVDLLNARSCYPMGKRMAENICYSYFKEFGLPVKIARLAQTFGRDILPEDNRVFVQFAKSVKNGDNIVLHTAGASMGNYCGLDDALDGLMTILNKGASGEAYNVVNEANTMSIRQMAELVASQVANGQIEVKVEIPEDADKLGYAKDTRLMLSGKKLQSLGWKPEQELVDMYRDVIKGLA